jgi:hypothetical protein
MKNLFQTILIVILAYGALFGQMDYTMLDDTLKTEQKDSIERVHSFEIYSVGDIFYINYDADVKMWQLSTGILGAYTTYTDDLPFLLRIVSVFSPLDPLGEGRRYHYYGDPSYEEQMTFTDSLYSTVYNINKKYIENL